MRIGIDVDGVLVDVAGYQKKYGELYFEQKLGMKKKNPKAFDVEEIYGCTHSIREKFWTRYIWKYCLAEPMTEGASDTVKRLKEDDHEIVIITGRAHTTEKGITGALFRFMLKHWLKKNGFIYDEIFYCTEKGSSKEKYDICINENIDFLVDDKPENLLPLVGKIKIACFPAPWNEESRELDAYRIRKFKDIIDMI